MPQIPKSNPRPYQTPEYRPPAEDHVCSKCRCRFKWVESRVGLCYWCDPKGKGATIAKETQRHPRNDPADNLPARLAGRS